MQNYSNLLIGLRVQTQIPLDVKQYIQNESTLSNLGIDNNLAFTYIKGLIIYCIEEGTRWEWKPSLGSGGLLTSDYVYPPGVTTFGIDYSNQAYNFYEVVNSSQVNSDWNAVSGVEEILNKPTIIVPPLEALDEGQGTGFRIRGRNNTFYGPIGDDAVDFSYSSGVSSTNGSIGTNSFSSGIDIKTPGYLANSFGYLIDNRGSGSFNGGYNLYNTGYTNSIFGTGHVVNSMNTTVIGQAANIITEQITDYNSTNKPMLVVGNGTITNNDESYNVLTRSDAFKVMFNGSVLAPSLTTGLITSDVTGKILITKEYLTSVAPNGSETKINPGTNVTITGVGTILSPYVINSTASGESTTYFDDGINTTVTGFGTLEDPYIINSIDTNTTYLPGIGLTLVGTTFNIDNLQKVITYPTDFTGTDYTLVNGDNNYEIIIDNGATNVTITIPSGLTSKLGVGFTQKGTGDITFVQSSTTIQNPIGLKIKGQFYQTFLSQELSTNNYFLGGNTKA